MALTENRDDFVSQALEKYADMVRRICYVYLHNGADVEDVFQEVFIKLLLRNAPFESEEHEKAWIIRISINECKDLLKSFWRRKITVTEFIPMTFKEAEENDVMEVVLALPSKFKDVIYLHYYEGYTVPQMAIILKKNENTIYSHLHRAKRLLKERLEGNEYGNVF